MYTDRLVCSINQDVYYLKHCLKNTPRTVFSPTRKYQYALATSMLGITPQQARVGSVFNYPHALPPYDNPFTAKPKKSLRLCNPSAIRILDAPASSELAQRSHSIVAPLTEDRFVIGILRKLYIMKFMGSQFPLTSEASKDTLSSPITHIAVADKNTCSGFLMNRDGFLHTFQNGRIHQIPNLSFEENTEATGLQCLSETTSLVSIRQRGIALVDTRAQEPTVSRFSRTGTTCIIKDPNTPSLISGTANAIEWWDLRAPQRILQSHPTNQPVTAIALQKIGFSSYLYAALGGPAPALESYSTVPDFRFQCSQRTDAVVRSILCSQRTPTVIMLCDQQEGGVVVWEYYPSRSPLFSFRGADQTTDAGPPSCGAFSEEGDPILVSIHPDDEALRQWCLEPCPQLPSPPVHQKEYCLR